MLPDKTEVKKKLDKPTKKLKLKLDETLVRLNAAFENSENPVKPLIEVAFRFQSTKGKADPTKADPTIVVDFNPIDLALQKLKEETLQEMRKKIEKNEFFIKAEDKKIELDLKKECFIRKSESVIGCRGIYSLHFPFVLNSHPLNPTTPISKEEWVRELEAEEGHIVFNNDHILLSCSAIRFAPLLDGSFVVVEEAVEKEIDGEKVIILKPDPKQAFPTLNELIDHVEGVLTPEEMLRGFSHGEAGFKPDLYTCKRVRDILAKNDTVSSYLEALKESHRKKDKPQPAAPAPQPPKRRYVRRSAAGR